MSAIDPIAEARQHIEKALVEKAVSDSAFREELKANPHAALKSLLGTNPIPSLKITVVEEAPGEVVLVLPRSIAQDELPDELLDMASGGVSFSSFVIPEGSMTFARLCPAQK
ncbi:NHLP leader peptide family RiPP precursor [Pannonibacter sp. Pt2]|uniref:NHLP leader peptide family RiPP n=1 Tax=Pannonibacter anstelovis TaxID=3121537 RepID=A0ABU7ZRT4_9HYPH